LKIGHTASRVLLLAIAGLFVAAASASAGDYSPAHLRAEGFLQLHSLDYQPSGFDLIEIPRGALFEKQRSRPKLKLQYALKPQPMGLQFQVQAKPQLRRLVNLEVRF